MTDLLRPSAGRPRSESSRNAILNATIDLIEKSGYPSLTVEGVASYAGVSKATIYRWWHDKTMLVLEAFLMLLSPQVEFRETSSVREDFISQLKAMASVFNSPIGRSMLAVISGSEPDSEVAQAFQTHYIGPKRNDVKHYLESGIERGEIRPGMDLDVVLEMIYGPLYFRLLIHKKMLDDSFIEALIGYVYLSVQDPT